jgi:anti-sigma B factor antagonist
MSQTSVVTNDAAAGPYAASQPFLCTFKTGTSAAWVHVEGELDIATSPELDRVLRAAELDSQLVVLDLRELTFVDISAIRVILDAASRVRPTGGRLMIARGPAHVDRVFALTGASERLSIFDLDAQQPDLLDVA